MQNEFLSKELSEKSLFERLVCDSKDYDLNIPENGVASSGNPPWHLETEIFTKIKRHSDVYMHVCMCVYVHIYVFMNVCMYMYVCVFVYAYTCTYTWCYGAQKRMSDSLELGLHMVLTGHLVLSMEPHSSAKVISALNH